MRAWLYYGDRRVDYSVTTNTALKSRVRIHVRPDGLVEVESPVGKSSAEIARAVAKRARWIHTNLNYFEQLRAHSLPRQYESGETHFYLGRRYQLKVIDGVLEEPSVRMKGGYIRVQLAHADPSTIKTKLRSWYKSRAKSYLESRLREISSELSWIDIPPPLTLMKMKSQWGSCSPAGRIYLNPMLIKAPRECIDYVIVHELCHLVEHNHSKRFYSLLQSHCQNWQQVKSKLDQMSELLLVE